MPRARERAQQKARQIIDTAQQRVDKARAQLADVIVAEYEGGARVTDLAQRAGYTRETIRRILRAAGVEPG